MAKNTNEEQGEYEIHNPELETDAVSFGKKDQFDKPSLVDAAIRNCLSKRSVDMRPGYRTHIQDKEGNVYVKIIEDSRKSFCGSVETLSNLLLQEIQSNEEFKKLWQKYKNEKQKLFNTFCYHSKKYKPVPDKEGFYVIENGVIKVDVEYTGFKYMPQKGELLPFPRTYKPQGKPYEFLIEKVEGYWDSFVDRYWDSMVDLCDWWFGELNRLISGTLKNYRKSGGM